MNNVFTRLKPGPKKRLKLLIAWVVSYYAILVPVGFIKIQWLFFVLFIAVQVLSFFVLMRICEYTDEDEFSIRKELDKTAVGKSLKIK